jgi:hypothetical protein
MGTNRRLGGLGVAPGEPEEAIEERRIVRHRHPWRKRAELPPLVRDRLSSSHRPCTSAAGNGIDADYPGYVVGSRPGKT